MNDWLTNYRTNKNAVWIKCRMCTGEWVYMDDLSEGWLDLVRRCNTEKIYIKRLSLQFRSHEVELNIQDADGIYLMKSVIGNMGGESYDCLTFGRVEGVVMKKQMWSIPDLLLNKSITDSVSECFQEAIVYDEFRKKEKTGDRQE